MGVIFSHDLAGALDGGDLAGVGEQFLQLAPLGRLLDLDEVAVAVFTQPRHQLGVVDRGLDGALLEGQGAGEQPVLLGRLGGLVWHGVEEVGEAGGQEGGAVLHAPAGGFDLLLDGRLLLVGQLLQTVVLAALLGDLADGPVGATVVSDAEGGALALFHGAEVDLLQLVEGDGRQRLGRGLGGLCLLFCGDGRGGFIAHAVAPFWCSAARVAASWL